MSSTPLFFALAALVPAMTGPVAAETGGEMTIRLCNGGMVSIPLDDAPSAPGESNTPCCAKGCHSGQSRKKLDRAQCG